MKKKLAMILAVVMLLGMILPQAALAAPAGTYYLSVKIEDTTAPAKTLTANSGYGSESTLLAAEVVALINANKSRIESTFAGTGLRDILEDGVTAFNAGGAAWTTYVTTYYSSVTGSFKDTLKDITSTYAALDVNVDNTVTYGNYTLTVTLKPYVYTPPVVEEPKPEPSEEPKPDDIVEETVENEDGSFTTTTTNNATGVTTTVNSDQEGKPTDINVDIPADAIKDEKPITLPGSFDVAESEGGEGEGEGEGGDTEDGETTPPATSKPATPPIRVNIPGGVNSVKVQMPMNNTKPSQVVVIVDEEGNETILPKSVVTEEGVLFELEGSATIKVVDNSKSFDDVSEEHWAGDAVAFVSAREMFQGVADDTFAPQDAMTRGMMVTVLYRLESEPDVSVQNVFSDIQVGAYYTDAVYWAVAKGIVDGYEDGSYRPDQNVTRQELVAMLYRYAGKPAVADNTLAFADAEDVHAYAKDAMRWAVDSGIVNGVTEDTLCPLKTATRAEVAAMLMRFCGYDLNKNK